MTDWINGYGESALIDILCNADLSATILDEDNPRHYFTLGWLEEYADSIEDALRGCLPCP